MNTVSHMPHQVLYTGTVCNQIKSNVPHPKVFGNVAKRALPSYNVHIPSTYIVNILVFSDDLKKHFDVKLVASRDFRSNTEAKQNDEKSFLLSGCE